MSYNNIASVYSEQGDYPAALKYFEKASDIYVRVLGTNHPNTATSYNNMGWVYCTQGDYPTAFNYFEKALKVCLQVLGVEHPNTALSVSIR